MGMNVMILILCISFLKNLILLQLDIILNYFLVMSVLQLILYAEQYAYKLDNQTIVQAEKGDMF